MAITKVGDWKPARQFPHTYPGDRPGQSYFLLNENVYLIFWEDTQDIKSAYFLEEGRHVYVDDILRNMNLPALTERYALLAYGANRNPATLNIKFKNYHYKTSGKGLALPVLKGSLQKADVVACNIFGQGYLYADLLLDSEFTSNTEVEAWLNLLDSDQLRVMNDSEGIKSGTYTLGQFPGYNIENIAPTISPLGYAGISNIFISPDLKKPLAFSTILAKNRTLPEMEPTAMFDHLFGVFEIRKKVAQITGLNNDETLSGELSKYLNGQWWYHFNTNERPIRGYVKVMELLENCIRQNSLRTSTTEYLKRKKLILTKEKAYSPGPEHTLQRLLSSTT